MNKMYKYNYVDGVFEVSEYDIVEKGFETYTIINEKGAKEVIDDVDLFDEDMSGIYSYTLHHSQHKLHNFKLFILRTLENELVSLDRLKRQVRKEFEKVAKVVREELDS